MLNFAVKSSGYLMSGLVAFIVSIKSSDPTQSVFIVLYLCSSCVTEYLCNLRAWQLEAIGNNSSPRCYFSSSSLIFISLFFPLPVWEVGHSWGFAVCWRAARRLRKRWRWPARATRPMWTSWLKTSTEATTNASAFRAPLWRPGECAAGFNYHYTVL